MYDQENQGTGIRWVDIGSNRKPLAERNGDTNTPTGARVKCTKDPQVLQLQTARNVGQYAKRKKTTTDCTALVSRRNERERERVKLLNLGFERLRAVVPSHSGEQLSKISTLKKAIWYIEHLDRVLHGQSDIDKATTSGTVHSRASHFKRPAVASDPYSAKPDSSTPISGRSNRAGDLAFGKAPWPSCETTLTAATNIGGRPTGQRLPSPIFPAQFNLSSNNEVIRQQPKKLQTALGLQSPVLSESGYSSLHLSNSQSTYSPQSMNLNVPENQYLSSSITNSDSYFRTSSAAQSCVILPYVSSFNSHTFSRIS